MVYPKFIVSNQKEESISNKQIQRIYVPRHYCLLFKWDHDKNICKVSKESA